MMARYKWWGQNVMARYKWWRTLVAAWFPTDGTRFGAYLQAAMVLIVSGLVALFGWLAYIVILEVGLWLLILVVGSPIALYVSVAETIHARGRHGR